MRMPGNFQNDEGQFIDAQVAVLAQLGGYIAGLPTYYAVAEGYASYATPTDMFAIRNPVNSGKVLLIRYMGLAVHSSAALLQKFKWLRYPDLAGVGTPTDLEAIPFDSQFDPAVGVARVYGADPTHANAGKIVNLHYASSPASLTGAPTSFNNLGMSLTWTPNTTDLFSPMIVRPGEELAVGLADTALAAGFTAACQINWSEFEMPA